MAAVNTLAGPVDATDLGVTYMHEHIFVLTPEMQAHWPGFGDWDEDLQVERAREDLRALKLQQGCDTIVDPTVAGLGRHVKAMARAAEGTGLNVVAATGYYTYADLPWTLWRMAMDAKIKLFTDLFVRDFRDGMEGTSIKPGILKCATDAPGLTTDVEAILRAVARAHHETGLPITTHTEAKSERGRDQQAVFAEEGVDLERVVIGHCNEARSLDYLLELLERGSYIGFDRCGYHERAPLEGQVQHLVELLGRGWVNRIVLSHDNVCFLDHLTRAQMEARLSHYPYGYVQAELLPALRGRGVTEKQIRTMLVDNPARVLGVEAVDSGIPTAESKSTARTA